MSKISRSSYSLEDTSFRAYLNFETDTNPNNLTKRQIHDLIKVCPLCATPWPKGKGKCANKECGVVVRVQPKALNWWMFYPKCNGWGHLLYEIEGNK